MEKIFPKSFNDLLGGLLLCFSIFYAIYSLFPKYREYATRMLAIFLMAALAVIANHWMTYFAAIFIVATAITELDFLQTLAAIIRSNKYYFDFKKAIITRKEIVEKIKKENEQQEPSFSKDNAQATSNTLNLKSDIRKESPKSIFVAKQMALTIMEERLKRSIERNLRFSKGNISIEVDGFIPRKGRSKDKIIEIRLLPESSAVKHFTFLTQGFKNIILSYKAITGQIPQLNLAILTPTHDVISLEELKQMESSLKKSIENLRIHFISKEELGLN